MNLAAARGDIRRQALLTSLDELLRESDGDLEDISIGKVSEAAGVTRSAFYFYFENKQAAVAALVDSMYREAREAGENLVGSDDKLANIEASITALFDAWGRHQHVYRAMLQARFTSPEVQRMWDADRESFIEPVAQMIAAEREAGHAPGGSDPTVLASTLLELNDRMLERVARGTPHTTEQIIETTVGIWHRAIYGRTTEAP